MHEFMKHEFNEILPVLHQILEIICVSEFHNDSYIGKALFLLVWTSVTIPTFLEILTSIYIWINSLYFF